MSSLLFGLAVVASTITTPVPRPAHLWHDQGYATPVVAPAPPPLPPPQVWSVSSTSYCTAGTMADGQQTYLGAVAGNIWPLGTVLTVLSGSHAGEQVTVADRIGWGSELDFFTWSCHAAVEYGREQIEVQAG